MSRRIAWMAHPLSGDIAGNLARAERWLEWLLRVFSATDFVADWILYCRVLDDTNPIDRERGLRMDEEVIGRCDDYVMVGGRVSSGMERERSMAIASGVRIVDLTALGVEPPELDADTLGALRVWMDSIKGVQHAFTWRGG